MEFPPATNGAGAAPGPHVSDEWADAMVRTVAHLAAQLTIAQIRLRALATELNAQNTVAASAVAARVDAVARAELGGYLRENLGEVLNEVIDVEVLEQELIQYLAADARATEE